MDLAECREWYSEFTGCDENWEDTLDPGIRDLVLYLNKLPGCATMCSCAGRGPIGGDKLGRRHLPGDWGYIMLKCTEVQIAALIVSAASLEKMEIRICDGTGDGPKTETISVYGPFAKMKRFEKRIKTLMKKYKAKKEALIIFCKRE